MKGAALLPFVHLFPEQGMAETRVFMVRGLPDLPDDYGLTETFCTDTTCHSRRVMINVAARRQGVLLASVSYAFDRDDPRAGPFLDPLKRGEQAIGRVKAQAEALT